MTQYNKSIVFTITFVVFFCFLFAPVLLHADATSKDGGNTSAARENSTVSLGPAISNNTDKVQVVASFFPIFEFVKKVGGDRVEVTTLIPFGTEPHDFDPTVQQVQNAQTADMVVFNGAGFEGERLVNLNAKFVLDISKGLNLTAATDRHTEENEHGDEVSFDPHIWLDPILAKQQVEQIRGGLIRIDPNNAEYYNKNANSFITELDDLDRTIRERLSNCEKKDFIAFHDAFGYFADRYGLTQHSIQGLSPEAEILPQRLQQVITLARDMGLDTIYSEELADPRLANVIAQEIPNGKVLVLSPIEGISKEEQNTGIGYLDKMNENIENLQLGLKCK
ncbi:MAG: zinc ABC transporter substrate-binding protein [Thermoproteota archaeon]|jgi:zinc transport system substrate-binding protein|nr:zinc ABC transporter substrate-binding protein [Thermoproteota archaeon]